ncbi:hypothetical protein [Algoriphagus formosus]|uniref:hypothetical protein n=1 Tax=Algoriphagus formosus TaxID=2007308 RepID=UPI003F71930F
MIGKMITLPQKAIIGVFLLFCLSACSKEGIQVELAEIKNNLVLFAVENHTDQDIYSIELEITYYSTDKSLLKTDTVSYSKTTDVSGNIIPFVKAGEETTITYSMPQETSSASARVLEFKTE